MFSSGPDSKGLLSVCGIHTLDDTLGGIDTETVGLLRIQMEHTQFLSRLSERRHKRRRQLTTNHFILIGHTFEAAVIAGRSRYIDLSMIESGIQHGAVFLGVIITLSDILGFNILREAIEPLDKGGIFIQIQIPFFKRVVYLV